MIKGIIRRALYSDRNNPQKAAEAASIWTRNLFPAPTVKTSTQRTMQRCSVIKTLAQNSISIPYVNRNLKKIAEIATVEPGLAILCNDPCRLINLFLAFHEEMAEYGVAPHNLT